jgi:hypothetical protein
MAEDLICLLDYIGWKEKRELNIVGISLGGMIAQGRFGCTVCSVLSLTDYVFLPRQRLHPASLNVSRL